VRTVARWLVMLPAMALISLALAGIAPALAQSSGYLFSLPRAPKDDPVREAADRTHAANEAEAKLRKTLLAVPKGACTKDVAETRKAYDAARKKTDAAINAEVDVSPEVQAARAELRAAEAAFDKLGPNADPAASRAASDRLDKARDAPHDADLAARKRIADREHFQPVLDPDCPPRASAPPPPVVPDPNSHASTTGSVLQDDVLQGIGVAAAPGAQPNRGDDTSRPGQPASAAHTGP
jgi:hypothetical protein